MQMFVGYVQRYQQAQVPKGGQQVRLGRNYFQEVKRRGREAEQTIPYPWVR